MDSVSENNLGAADLGNWRTSPHSRWAFHHVADLVPTAKIACDPRHSSDLRTASRRMDGFKLDLPDGGALDLASFHALTATDAMVVLVDGEIAYEHYANGNSVHQPHILMSAGKSVLGLIAGVLAQSGDLDVDAPVSSYLPALAGTAYEEATARHLLDMRVAITFDEARQRAYDLATNWEPAGDGERQLGLGAFFESLEGPAAECEGPFSYVSANTDLLGLVVERATGQPLASLVSELLWKPMGARDDAYVTLDRDGAARPTGGFGATARDLARLGQLVLHGGQWDDRESDRPILPSAWLKDTLEGGDHQAWRTGGWGQIFAPLSRNLRYRNSWYVADDQPKLLFAMGVHGQNLFVDIENRMVVAKLSSQADRTDARAIGLTHWALPALRRVLLRQNG